MIISEYIDNRRFGFDTDMKVLSIDDGEYGEIKINIEGIKTLLNLFKFLEFNQYI